MQVGSQPNNTNALKYKTEEDLKRGIDEYFQDCENRKAPYTMSGLANCLGIDRTTLINYGKRDLFSTLIKEAKAKVQQQIEENALCGKGNSTFSIFNLKNNYGWVDSVEVKNETLEKVDELLDKIKDGANE